MPCSILTWLPFVVQIETWTSEVRGDKDGFQLCLVRASASPFVLGVADTYSCCAVML